MVRYKGKKKKTHEVTYMLVGSLSTSSKVGSYEKSASVSLNW